MSQVPVAPVTPATIVRQKGYPPVWVRPATSRPTSSDVVVMDRVAGEAALPGRAHFLPPGGRSPTSSRTRALRRRRSRSRRRSSPRRGRRASRARPPWTAWSTRRIRARTSPGGSETPVPTVTSRLRRRDGTSQHSTVGDNPPARKFRTIQRRHDPRDPVAARGLGGRAQCGRELAPRCERSLRCVQYGTRSCAMQRLQGERPCGRISRAPCQLPRATSAPSPSGS
jgi:hypothetical protein